jgi:DNA polymerase I-like protein with 3'-5' exonuclease and polymerase domains
MGRISAAFADASLKACMFLQIHDELLFEMPEADGR